MNTNDSAFAYQQSAGVSASPVGQVVALYDRILRDFRQASVAAASGEVEKRVQALNHAQTIIGELQGVLDFERGGEAAKRLNSFYNVARAMLMKAGAENSTETLQELVSMFTRMRAAWAHVERTAKPSEPAEQLRISSRAQGNFSVSAAPLPETSSGSGSGKWSA